MEQKEAMSYPQAENDELLTVQAAEDVSMIRQNGKTIATRRKILTRLELEGGFNHGKLVTFQVDTGATCNVLRAQELPNDVTLKSEESSRLSFFNGPQKGKRHCKISGAGVIPKGILFHL